MTEYVLPNGLHITDRRHHRGLPTFAGDDGRLDLPNDSPPGDAVHTDAGTGNTYAPISVGPNASAGYGNTHVMHPRGAPHPAAWSGWPVDWSTSWSSSPSGMLGQWGRLCDVVFAALDLNSSILAAMPPTLIDGTEPKPERPWIRNPEPEVYPSWYAWSKEAFWSLVATGETFLYATSHDGEYPDRFMVVNPAFVQVDRVAGVLEYSIAGDVVDPADVLHIKYASWPGDLRGHGPLEVAGARLLACQALVQYSTNQAASGGQPPVVLRHPKRLNRVQMQQMQQDYVSARMSGMGLPAVLSDGTELDVLSSDLKDITVSELERFSEARVATLLGTPAYLLGINTGDTGTYANSTNVFDFHWRAFLRPRAEQVMEAMSGWLLPETWDIELNRDDYVRPSLFERAQSYSMLIGSGVLTPAEVRILERYHLPAGDDAPTTPPAPADATPPTVYGAGGRPVITNTNPTQGGI